MAILDDFTLNYTTKKISHASGSTRYTVNALYSALQDLFDELGQLDDDVPMKANTPTEYELINGWSFNADSDYGYLYGGSIATGTTETWANFYTIGSLAAGAHVYVMQNGSLVTAPPGYTTGHIDMLVKVRAASADVDARNVTVFSRDFGNSYDHFKVQAPTTGGRNPVPLATSADINNTTLEATVAAYGVTVTFGTVSKDVGDGNGAQNYDVTISCNNKRLSQVYEFLKYTTRQGETATGTNGTIAGQFYTAANAAYSELKVAPYGTFAGGKFFGARGVWIEGYDALDGNAFQLIDAAGSTRTPPTTISVAVAGIVAGDRVFVARTSGGVINKSQFTIASANATTIVVNEVVTADIPATGIIRVGDTRFAYTALNRATKTFTVSTSAVGQSGACYVPLIDEEAAGTSISKSIVYASDIPVKARVRKKGILPFEVDTTVTNVGASIAAIRTTDTVVQ